jgi:cell division protein FtsB
VPLDTMLDQVRGLGDQLAALAGRNEELALEVGALRERVGHRDAAVARLEAERDALQAEVGRLRSGQDAPVAAPDAPHEAEPAGAARRDSRPWWRFWGRG